MAQTKKPVSEKHIKTMISMPPDLKDRLDSYCLEHERPMSWVIQKALAEWLDKQQ